MPVVIQKRGGRPTVVTTITPEAIRDLLFSLPEDERRFITSDPSLGQHKVLSIRRNASGNLEYDYEE